MNNTIHYILQELALALMAASTDEALLITDRSIDQLQGYMRLYTFRDQGEGYCISKSLSRGFWRTGCTPSQRRCSAICSPGWNHRSRRRSSMNIMFGQMHRDGFYFRERTCEKLNFEAEENMITTEKSYDKWVARILAEQWWNRK